MKIAGKIVIIILSLLFIISNILLAFIVSISLSSYMEYVEINAGLFAVSLHIALFCLLDQVIHLLRLLFASFLFLLSSLFSLFT